MEVVFRNQYLQKKVNDGIFYCYLSTNNDFFPSYRYCSEEANSLIGIMSEGDSSSFIICDIGFNVYPLKPEFRILIRLYNKSFGSNNTLALRWKSKDIKSKS